MTREEVRLECLKLAHTRAVTAVEAVGRAKEYEAYVIGSQDESSTESVNPLKKGKRSQKVDNPDPLS